MCDIQPAAFMFVLCTSAASFLHSSFLAVLATTNTSAQIATQTQTHVAGRRCSPGFGDLSIHAHDVCMLLNNRLKLIKSRFCGNYAAENKYIL